MQRSLSAQAIFFFLKTYNLYIGSVDFLPFSLVLSQRVGLFLHAYITLKTRQFAQGINFHFSVRVIVDQEQCVPLQYKRFIKLLKHFINLM